MFPSACCGGEHELSVTAVTLCAEMHLQIRRFHFAHNGRRLLSIHEVARRANVSIATVSRTINGVPTVTPQLSRRVWKVIEEIGYYPDTQARALVSGRSRL